MNKKENTPIPQDVTTELAVFSSHLLVPQLQETINVISVLVDEFNLYWNLI